MVGIAEFQCWRYFTLSQVPSPQGLQVLKWVRPSVRAPGKKISAFGVHGKKLALGLKIKEE